MIIRNSMLFEHKNFIILTLIPALHQAALNETNSARIIKRNKILTIFKLLISSYLLQTNKSNLYEYEDQPA